MNSFVTLSEQTGRDISINFLVNRMEAQEVKPSKNTYTNYDLVYKVKGRTCMAEIKTRDYPHNAFSTWILEHDKYEMLQDIQQVVTMAGGQVTIHYINIFTDGVMLIWKIDDIHLTPVKEHYVKTTCSDNGSRDKVVYHLPRKAASKYNIQQYA